MQAEWRTKDGEEEVEVEERGGSGKSEQGALSGLSAQHRYDCRERGETTIPKGSFRLRARRSYFVTTTTSPFRSFFSIRSSSGRDRVVPVIVSAGFSLLHLFVELGYGSLEFSLRLGFVVAQIIQTPHSFLENCKGAWSVKRDSSKSSGISSLGLFQ